MKTKILFILLVFLIAPLDMDAQCSMCRAVLESQATPTAAEGINDGIVYLMIFPYLLMAGVAYFIWRSRKQQKSEEDTP